MADAHSRKPIVSIHPYYRGFGFAILDPLHGLIDWGVARLYSKNRTEFLVRLSHLFKAHTPALLVGEDGAGTTRRAKMLHLMNVALDFAAEHGIGGCLVSRGSVYETLDARTQYEAAERLATQLPELEQHLPHKRKPWQNEDERMFLFVAVGLAVTAMRNPQSRIELRRSAGPDSPENTGERS